MLLYREREKEREARSPQPSLGPFGINMIWYWATECWASDFETLRPNFHRGMWMMNPFGLRHIMLKPFPSAVVEFVGALSIH